MSITRQATILGIAPILEVRDIARSADFYREALGFEIGFVEDEPPRYAICCRGAVELHLRHAAQPRNKATVYLYVADARALLEALRGKNLTPSSALCLRDEGMAEFELTDPDGHTLRIGTRVRPDGA